MTTPLPPFMLGKVQLPAELERMVKLLTEDQKASLVGGSLPSYKTRKFLPLEGEIFNSVRQQLESLKTELSPYTVQGIELFGMIPDKNQFKLASNFDYAVLNRVNPRRENYLLLPVSLPKGYCIMHRPHTACKLMAGHVYYVDVSVKNKVRWETPNTPSLFLKVRFSK